MQSFDVSDLAAAVAALDAHGRARRLAVVVPIAPGKRDVVRDYLAEGPPFDPRAVGLERHEVYLTDDEAVFVFEARGGVKQLEAILADHDFWDVVRPWEHVVAGRPRIAEIAFDWTAPA